jgi:hypothetical protein
MRSAESTVETMALENNEDVAYLMALKGTESAASAPARETASATTGEFSSVFSTQPEYHGGEKRRTPRYKCEGRAELCEAGCDVHTPASLTDVSLHGCYVETQAIYPVGTTLTMKLQTHGRKVEVTGVVRVNYPSQGMGIAFIETTDSNRAELKDLLASMSRPMVIMGPGITSSLRARVPIESAPPISDPMAAVQALLDFFEDRQMLMREDFLRVLRQSQTTQSKP